MGKKYVLSWGEWEGPSAVFKRVLTVEEKNLIEKVLDFVGHYGKVEFVEVEAEEPLPAKDGERHSEASVQAKEDSARPALEHLARLENIAIGMDRALHEFLRIPGIACMMSNYGVALEDAKLAQARFHRWQSSGLEEPK